ncbi:MAG: type I restriction endonuclease, partial [Campylobacterota bacterium]|nr:type I restriction endonuclease [Campylobacterota bacterium]
MKKYNEKEYEDFIDNHLANNGYEPRHYKNYDRSLCLDTELLFNFLENSQSKELEQLKTIYGNDYKTQIAKRLFKQIQSKTIVEVLRDGIKDNGIKLNLAFDKPNSNLNEDDNINYTKNIFSVMRQVHFSTKNEKSLDMVLFLNGLPIITLELKNELTGQNVNDAIKQYKQDRNPKEELFKFGRCLVHFAVDTSLVYMTTKLLGQKTFFLPFNKGLNAGNTDKDLKKGAGNPSCETMKTAYLWEDIFTKDRLIDIVKNYTQYIEEKDKETKQISKKIIFPRFHQLDVVTKLLDDVSEKGVGEKYLIQHSAGSGKSNSISWLAHQLVSHMDSSGTKPIFDTVIVVTDRKVLDKQIQDNIKGFAKVKKVVEAITDGSKQLKQSLKDGKKIIISTIQKFPYIVDDIGDLSDKNFAIIIDEAHSSTSGSSMQGMAGSISKETLGGRFGCDLESEEERTIEDEIVDIIRAKKLQKNASYFAFTATPKNKTLEIFGTDLKPFHLYSMKQAIEENFIIDVLKNYITYNSYYKLLKAIDDDPKYDTKRASRKLKHHVEIQKVTIDKKIQIVGEHFFDNVIK